MLDLTPLARAIDRLSEALVAYRTDEENTLIRDAVIQRFEFTYEISHKMLKRYLEMTSADPQAFDEMSFQNLIRIGSERGLLRSGWDRWRDYRHARSATSHTYDEVKAIEVLKLVPEFRDEALTLLERLRERS